MGLLEAAALVARRGHAIVESGRHLVQLAQDRLELGVRRAERLLGKRLHGALGPLAHVNVIPLNPTPGSEWDASPKPAEREFVKRVRDRGVSCTVRDTRGREIAAACGQLAAQG